MPMMAPTPRLALCESCVPLSVVSVLASGTTVLRGGGGDATAPWVNDGGVEGSTTGGGGGGGGDCMKRSEGSWHQQAAECSTYTTTVFYTRSTFRMQEQSKVTAS